MKLSRYERVDVIGASPLAGPRFPTLVDIVGTDNGIKVRLAVSGPTDDEVEARFFNLNWLTETFKPVKVQRSP